MHWSHFALLAICAFAFWSDSSRLHRNKPLPAISRVAAIFLANSVAVTFWALAVNPVIDPVFQFCVDLISAALIMRPPAKEMNGWFGIIFGARMGATMHYYFNGGSAMDLWLLMNYSAQLMMIVLFLWSETNGGKLVGLLDRADWYIRNRYARIVAN